MKSSSQLPRVQVHLAPLLFQHPFPTSLPILLSHCGPLPSRHPLYALLRSPHLHTAAMTPAAPPLYSDAMAISWNRMPCPSPALPV